MLPIARKENIVVQESGSDLLVYDLDTNRAICLNNTSSLIWKKCDGTKSPWEIGTELQGELGVAVSEDLIWFALEQLQKEHLLKSDDDFTTRYAGLSRREVIRKIGLTSVVVLPIIASLTAPMAISAQSLVCNTGITCNCTISGMDSDAFPNMACAPPNTGGCNMAVGCVCMANSSGNPISPGTCI